MNGRVLITNTKTSTSMTSERRNVTAKKIRDSRSKKVDDMRISKWAKGLILSYKNMTPGQMEEYKKDLNKRVLEYRKEKEDQ